MGVRDCVLVWVEVVVRDGVPEMRVATQPFDSFIAHHVVLDNAKCPIGAYRVLYRSGASKEHISFFSYRKGRAIRPNPGLVSYSQESI